MPTRNPRKKREWNAWAVYFVHDEDLYPLGTTPYLYETKASALGVITTSGFDSEGDCKASPVRVTISIDDVEPRRAGK